jgi:hypothetical protein
MLTFIISSGIVSEDTLKCNKNIQSYIKRLQEPLFISYDHIKDVEKPIKICSTSK